MRGPALLTLAVAAFATPSLRAQAPVEAGGLETRVWLDRGDEPVLRRGETVRIYYRATQDAFAAIFRIDTDGRISLIFPQDPLADALVRAGTDYRLVLPNSPVWRVDDDPGAGYFFMIASPEPLDLSVFPFDRERGWDLRSVGSVVYDDPYVAIDEYVAQLIPDWDVVPYALDFITYNVGDTYTYPRFLCYDCHDARPYTSWNPYSVACTTYRVVIWDDPYFYPYYRYSGTNVVVARPLVTQPRYAVAARAPGDSFRPLVRTRPAPPRVGAEFKEAPLGRNPTATPSATPRQVAPQPSQEAPRPTLQRRPTAPTSRLPVRTPPPTRGSASPAPSAGSSDPRIVRPSRPSAVSPSPTPPTSRPSRGVTPQTTRGGTGGVQGAPAPVRPSVQRSPTSRPSGPSAAPSQRPAAPSQRPAAPSQRPAAPTGTRPAAPSRPTARPAAPSQPRAQPSAPSRPTAQPSAPSRAPSSKPTVQPRTNNSGTRPGG